MEISNKDKQELKDTIEKYKKDIVVLKKTQALMQMPHLARHLFDIASDTNDMVEFLERRAKEIL